MRTVSRQCVLILLLGTFGVTPPDARGEEAWRSDRELLQGTWVCVGTLLDGKPVDKYAGVRAVVEGDNLTWHFPQQDGSFREQKNKFRIDPIQDPPHFDWWPADKPDSVDRRIYSVDDEMLLMATNLDYATRPKTFSAGRWQFIVKRVVDNVDGTTTGAVPGWGAPHDPDGDCAVRVSGLTIRLPAGLHDHWFGRQDVAKRYNAPRVLQAVEGDFLAQVKVTADWTGPPLPSGEFSRAAGLIVWESQRHYLRHERNVFVPIAQPDLRVSWVPPLYDRNDQRISEWKSGPDTFFQGRSTWLRVERAGQQFTTSISHDGQQWTSTGTVTTEFPAKVQVGVVALGKASAPWEIEFEDFKLLAM